ncbi:MAG: hypothetical protein ACQETZ_07365 [Candidatus Fermentibacterota bacterium]
MRTPATALLATAALLVLPAASGAQDHGPGEGPGSAPLQEGHVQGDDGGAVEEPEPRAAESETEDGGGSGEGGEEEEEGFLDPYYHQGHEGGGSSTEGDGCFDSCSGGLLSDLGRLLFSVEITHHAIPYRHGMVRHRLGEGGSPVSLSVEGGMTTAGGGKGALASARFWTPSPFFLGGCFVRIRPDDSADFSLAYPEVGLEVLYDLPVTLSGSGHLLVAWEEGRDPLFGGGMGTSASVFLSELFEVDVHYRLSWLEELPLHSGTARFCWNITWVSAWGGYTLVRNSDGDIIDGPVAGLRLRI